MFGFFKEVYLETKGIDLSDIDEIMKVKEAKREKWQKILYKTILIIALLGHTMMHIFSVILFENINIIILTIFDFIFIAIVYFKYWKTINKKYLL